MKHVELEIKDKTQPLDHIKIAPFRKNIRQTKPHKHNKYFEIIYLKAGKGQHTIDSRTFDIQPPTIFLIRKEQLHFWNIETEPAGFVLILKKAFVDACMDSQIKLLLNEISSEVCLQPKDNSMIEQLFELLHATYELHQPGDSIIIEGLLKALLAKLLHAEKNRSIPQTHKNSIFQQYLTVLAEGKNLVNNVAHYAKLLHTTPQNLNAICRKERQQSAAEILAEYIISEAKRLLLYSDFSIKEIAFALEFKDNSHFTKYFKRHTSMTPNVFRAQVD